MRYVSLFSGIEAASVAWGDLEWDPVAYCEIDKFASAVLAHRKPGVPNLGDVTKVDWEEFARANGPIDLMVFGSPCQSFSVAGKRLGLGDPRGNLALYALQVVNALRPRWFVFENVPGILSSDGGRDFGAFLGLVGELGYGFAYRVLDAQYVRTRRFPWAVPQRRRRVFVVGYLGDWRRAAAVLFDGASLRGHPPPRREAGASVAALTANGVGTCGADDNQGQAGHLIASTGHVSHCLNAGGMGRQDYETETLVAQVAPTLRAGGNRTGGDRPPGTDVDTVETLVAHSLRAEGFDASEGGTGRGTPLVPVAFDTTQITHPANRSNPQPGDPSPTLSKGGHAPAIAFSSKDHGADAMTECSPTLRAGGHAESHANAGVPPAIAYKEDRYADAYEADASSLLSTLRRAVGAEAFQQWGLRVLASLRTPEVMRAWMRGESIRSQAEDFRSFVDDCPLPRAEGSAGRTLLKVWEQGPDGRSPQGRGLAKQLAGQPGEALSVLPYEGASSEGDVLHLREAHEGARLLREALSAVQEVGRPAADQGEPAQRGYAVRRLTPLEAERLQGFPDGWTDVPYRGKPASDGPRYKALGNSMAVNVMGWIGERIAMVDALPAVQEAAE